MLQAVIEKKKGGPYTKEQQEDRREYVCNLYFNIGYSARKIAAITKVHRNTINSDIKFHYSQIGLEFEKIDVKKLVMKQIERLEFQRLGLFKIIEEKQLSFSERLALEKIILDIDNKICNNYTKIYFRSREDFTEK